MPARKKTPVWLYIPNLIDYGRLILLAVAFFYIDESPSTFLVCYVLQVFLDFFDGYFAKLFDQVSVLGAWLDVVLDNIGRGILWTYLTRYGFLISCAEWLAFSCTQQHGAYWKKLFENSDNLPFIARQVFKNNFKSPLGITAIAGGLQSLPILLYSIKHYAPYLQEYSQFINYILIYCIFGRIICFYVESWVIFKHIQHLIQRQKEIKKSSN